MKSIIQTLFTAAAAIVATFAFTATPVQAKQCVFNKGGYVLEVQWYRQTDIGMHYKGREGGSMKKFAPPVQSNSLTAGFGACTNTDEVLTLVAGVIRCAKVQAFGVSLNCGYGYVAMDTPLVHFANSSRGGELWIDPKTLQYSVTKILGNPSCPSQLECFGTIQLPNSESVLIAAPSTTQYLDFFGTIFDVQWAAGGPIN